MIKTFNNVSLTVISERSEEQIDFSKLSGKLNAVDNSNFMFTEVIKKSYQPREKFFDGRFLSVIVGDDNSTIRCYVKSFTVDQAEDFLTDFYQELTIAVRKLGEFNSSNTKE